jgi:uncharacterized protein (TIGR04255 family)
MRFPPSERVVFERNPLTEVVCQLRFPTVLQIATEPPTVFQNAVRANYPMYRRDQGLPFALPGGQAFQGLSFPMPPEAVTHWFSHPDSSLSLSLGSQFIAVTDRDYTEWSRMRGAISDAIEALSTAYAPAFFERAGLRYRNVIDRASLELRDVPWVELISSQLTGMLGAAAEIRSGVTASQSVVLLALDEPLSAQVQLATVLETPDRFVVDADFFLGQRKEINDVTHVLDSFNVESGRLFRWAIRPTLRESLGQRDS